MKKQTDPQISAPANINTRNFQQPLTVLYAERADNPERKKRHHEHIQVSRVRVVPQTPPVVRPKVNHDRST